MHSGLGLGLGLGLVVVVECVWRGSGHEIVHVSALQIECGAQPNSDNQCL